MGSPYNITCVSRVNVVRSSRGFLRLSKELFSITGCDLNDIAATVAAVIDNPTHPAWVYMVFDDDVDRGMEAFRSFLCERLPESWHSFVNPYLDFCMIVVSAKACNNREVVTVTARYTFDESQRLDRAVVLDFTLRKGH